MWHLGIDIGGTFTDFVLSLPGGAVHTHKRLTTRRDPSRAVLAGARELLNRIPLKGEGRVNHGTTLITNAIVERRGAKTALLTTRGFKDVLEIRREGRYDLYDLRLAFSEPLAPADLRREVDERLDAQGRVIRELNAADATAVLGSLGEQGVESLAVVLLHAYTDPRHENALLELARTALPGVPVSLSSRVAPEIREYERTSTTVANAYVRPITENYLEDLVRGLEQTARDHGTEARISLMQSDGGSLSPGEAAQVPIRLVESGPAGGVLAAARFQERLERRPVLSFDMGGTTAKMAFLDSHGPRYTRSFEVDRRHVYRRGSGLPLLIPAMDMVEIGAGGGSYARVNALGTVQVGPESAGSDPGPAAYALGGDRPTVTDADLALGFLNPEYFLGGRMTLDPEAARNALQEHLSRPLGCTVRDAAAIVYRTVTANMADATRVHAAEHGIDLGANTLVAFGGAGPMHAWGLARHLRVDRILYPGHAGVESALGFLAAAESYEASRTAPCPLDSLTQETMDAVLNDLRGEAGERLSVPPRNPAEVSVSMRYRGQGSEITVPLRGNVFPEGLRREFLQQYRALYGHTVENIPIDVVTWRLRLQGDRPAIPAFDAVDPDPPPAGTPEPHGSREVWSLDDGAFAPTPVYRSSDLEPGMALAGPAVVEDPYSTVVLGRGRARVLAGNTLAATLGEVEP